MGYFKYVAVVVVDPFAVVALIIYLISRIACKSWFDICSFIDDVSEDDGGGAVGAGEDYADDDDVEINLFYWKLNSFYNIKFNIY